MLLCGSNHCPACSASWSGALADFVPTIFVATDIVVPYNSVMPKTTTAQEPKAVRAGREAHLNVVLAANRSLDAVEEICAAEGISHSQYVALWNLCLADDADAGVPIGEIADG